MIFFLKTLPRKREREKKRKQEGKTERKKEKNKLYCSVNINILEKEISGTPKSAWTTFLRPTALQSGRHSPAPR